MSKIFDIEKNDVISDEENYYFFRALEPGDIEDLEKGIIKNGEKYIRINICIYINKKKSIMYKYMEEKE